MKLSDKAEEILEKLWAELVEGGRSSFDGTAGCDPASIAELRKHGYVRGGDDAVTLTEKGRDESRDCARRHRLAERLMVDVFDLKKARVHETGCEFEHLLHKGLDESVCTLLGHPRLCPHGRPIPEGPCCRELRKVSARLVTPLTEMDVHGKAEVAYLRTGGGATLQKLIAIGLLPGTEIVLLRKSPTYVLQMGKAQFAIDEALASNVHVRRKQK